MMQIKLNDNFKHLSENYLFSEIKRKRLEYELSHPLAKIIDLGIGDVSLPIPPSVSLAMSRAVFELSDKTTFRGYAPENGYQFLRDAISRHYYDDFKVSLSSDEIFISDGAKDDVSGLCDILGENEIVLPNPIYPVYKDSNLLLGRNINYVYATKENNFLPLPEDLAKKAAYIIYLASPNNPSGAVYSKKQLQKWVCFAAETGSLIIYDSAYEAYITDDSPHSIYEIEGAEKCAIEVASFSKNASFTGVRCSWSVLPSKLVSGGVSLNKLWKRRQATKTNGVSYISQKGAEAVFSPNGKAEIKNNIRYYLENSKIITRLLKEKNIFFTGGISSPYIWFECPFGLSSWELFDLLLNQAKVVGTAGEGFGEGGKNYFRLTAFADREDICEAVDRLEKIF